MNHDESCIYLDYPFHTCIYLPSYLSEFSVSPGGLAGGFQSTAVTSSTSFHCAMGDDDEPPNGHGDCALARPLPRAQWRLDPLEAPEAAAVGGSLETALSSLAMGSCSLQCLEDFNGALVAGGHDASEAPGGAREFHSLFETPI